MTMVTTTLFKIIQSELIKLGRNEFEGTEKQTSLFDFGTFDFFKNDLQFTNKLFSYDDDIKLIVNWLFNNFSLDVPDHDEHFKKMFIYKFVNRQIQKQTIESFKYDIAYVFLSQKDYINRVYIEGDKYINQLSESENNSNSNSSATNKDNKNDLSENETIDRSATSNLPNSTLSFNLNDDIFKNPSNADARKNKTITNNSSSGDSETKNNSESNEKGISKTYSLDDLIKSSNLLEKILEEFDKKCFLQIW